MKFEPYDYQKRAIDTIIEKPDVGLLLEMGLGKTVISLTAVRQLIDDLDVFRVLVIAPLKVAEDTWSRESLKWDHLQDLKISKILGDRNTRIRAAEAEADVYVINCENTAWLVENYGKAWKWDMLIIDELSKFKNSSSGRFRALRKVRSKCSRIVGLTGTPNPNSLLDLWAEIYLLDGGERLGRYITRYRQAYFQPGAHRDYVVYEWVPRPGAMEQISKRIEDITVSMKAADYIRLPKRIDNVVPVILPEDAKRKYLQLEQVHLLELKDTEITATNAAAVMGKLLQLSGGAVYDDEGGYAEIHQAKLEVLKEIIDTAQEPVLVFYGYRHERERILKYFEGYGPRELKNEQDIEDWNAGRIGLLIAHPASVGYGLNLQQGGHRIIWYSLPWSLELYQQANARLYRQGQTKPVIISHLIAEGTVDENVMKSLQKKDLSQAALMEALKERRKK